MSTPSSILSHKEFFAAIRADFLAGAQVWRETSQEVFDDMLGALPPAYMGPGSFAMGEPYTIDGKGRQIFTYFIERSGRCFGLYCALCQIRDGSLPALPQT